MVALLIHPALANPYPASDHLCLFLQHCERRDLSGYPAHGQEALSRNTARQPLIHLSRNLYRFSTVITTIRATVDSGIHASC
jgi:hypothetical protein